MLEHGGYLNQAARHFGIPPEAWLDLSTGIAPWSYPLPAVPEAVWQRLPEEDDGLEAVAADYYGFGGGSSEESFLMLPGSQAAIQSLPHLLPPGRVAMATPLYNEHPAAWKAAGHQAVAWQAAADYAVLCRPNNPTGVVRDRDELLERARQLRLLVVDEAFIDAGPSRSSLIGCGRENVVVLRSLGKFFGLAGVRLGCVIGPKDLLGRLREVLGPWAVSHPARWAARQALADRGWHERQRGRLQAASVRLDDLLRQARLNPSGGCSLFSYCPTPRAAAIHEALARRGILVRLFSEPAALRFGLPAGEGDEARLARALREVMA